METSKEGRFWCLNLGGHSETLIVSHCPRPDLTHNIMGMLVGLSLTHTDMAQLSYVCIMKVVNCDEF